MGPNISMRISSIGCVCVRARACVHRNRCREKKPPCVVPAPVWSYHERSHQHVQYSSCFVLEIHSPSTTVVRIGWRRHRIPAFAKPATVRPYGASFSTLLILRIYRNCRVFVFLHSLFNFGSVLFRLCKGCECISPLLSQY
jgi:hypothetical protein